MLVVVTTRGLFSLAAVKISSALVSSREREGISQVEQTSLQTRGATSSDIPPDEQRLSKEKYKESVLTCALQRSNAQER